MLDEGTPGTDLPPPGGTAGASDLPVGTGVPDAGLVAAAAAATGDEGHALTPAAGQPGELSWVDSAVRNREGDIVPAWQAFSGYGSSAPAVGDPGVVHSGHEALGGAGETGGLAVPVFDGNSQALQAWDASSLNLAERVLDAPTQPTGDGRFADEFDVCRTETTDHVGQFFSPTPPEADFDAYAARVGLPDSSRTSPKPDVVLARILTDADGSKHFVTGHTVPQGLTDQAAASLEVSHDPGTGAPRFNVGSDSFRAPGGDLNIVAEKGWYVVTERLTWDEYVARRDELIARWKS